MDILLTQAAVLHLMTSRRSGAIVVDGPTDLQLWRPPGPERDFSEAYGPQLPDVLDKERRRLADGKLKHGELSRLHPGKLHCDFVIWVATREPHAHLTQSPAPTLDVVFKAAKDALAFAAARNVVRIAFGPLGAGPGEAPVAERLAAIVRAASEYKDECTAQARSLTIEEVLVCHPSSAVVSQAQRMVQRLAKPARPEPTPATASTPTRARKATSTRTATGKVRATRPSTKLSADDIQAARAVAPPYDRTQGYVTHQWIVHPSFGVGRVDAIHEGRMISVRFEDGELRKLIHNR